MTGDPPVEVKICGISDGAALDACIEARVDWVGFVLFPRSPRHVTHEAASRLAARLPPSIGAVALLVSPSDDDVLRALDAAPFAALQIYDSAARAAGIQARFATPVWHASPIAARSELPAVADTAKLVVEARVAGADRPGGHGAALDWSMLTAWRAPVPWILAGGLTPTNVADAIRRSGARAVDVSSGVESALGRKDPDLIRAFAAAAKAQ